MKTTKPSKKQRILQVLRDHPGAYTTDIQDELGLARIDADLSYYRKKGYVTVTKDPLPKGKNGGYRYRWYIKEPTAAANWFGPTLPEVDEQITTTAHPMVGEIAHCEVCDREFTIAAAKITPKHYFCSDHASFRDDFICEECDKQFDTNKQMVAHVRMSHTGSGQEARKLGVERASEVRTQRFRQRLKTESLEKAAKDYIWQTDNNDLRKFIAWYKENFTDESTN